MRAGPIDYDRHGSVSFWAIELVSTNILGTDAFEVGVTIPPSPEFGSITCPGTSPMCVALTSAFSFGSLYVRSGVCPGCELRTIRTNESGGN
jgi:hypothetical protein